MQRKEKISNLLVFERRGRLLYETQAAIAHFRQKYHQYTLKRMTENNWKENHLKNSTREVGLHWLEKSCWWK